MRAPCPSELHSRRTVECARLFGCRSILALQPRRDNAGYATDREAVGLYIPSPSQGVWHLGPFPVRGYALCILAGIVVAAWLARRRWAARGGVGDDVLDIAMWAVPFGLLGGRLYHVVTDP